MKVNRIVEEILEGAEGVRIFMSPDAPGVTCMPTRNNRSGENLFLKDLDLHAIFDHSSSLIRNLSSYQ